MSHEEGTWKASREDSRAPELRGARDTLSTMLNPLGVTIGGLTVRVMQDPRYYGSLPADVPVTAAFRAEFDAWAKEFFPPHPENSILKDGEVTVLMGRTVLMNPRTFEAFKKTVKGSL